MTVMIYLCITPRQHSSKLLYLTFLPIVMLVYETMTAIEANGKFSDFLSNSPLGENNLNPTVIN